MNPGEAQPSGVRDVLHGAAADFMASEQRGWTAAATAGAIATAAVNFAKIPLVTAPTLALEALQYTDNPAISGVVTGVVFGTWTYVASGVINRAGNHYPEAKARAAERFPTKVEFLADALPGFNFESKDQQEIGRVKRIGTSALAHLRRGTAALGFGGGLYMATAQLKQKPEAEIHRLRRVLAGDGAFVIGSITCTAAEIVTKLDDSHPVFAEHIQNNVTDTKTLMGVALALILGQGFGSRRRAKRRAVGSTLPVPE